MRIKITKVLNFKMQIDNFISYLIKTHTDFGIGFHISIFGQQSYARSIS